MKPLVTIGVPFYNAQDYIINTLNSIKVQTYPNIQLILVNDCSTDESLKRVKEWLVQNCNVFVEIILLENSENRGTSYSCKKIEESSKGTFFSKLDADDLIHTKKIATQVDYLLEHPHIALVYSNTLLIDSQGKIMDEDYFSNQKFMYVSDKIGPSGQVFDKLLREDFIPNSSVMIRKSILDEVGGYDETLFTEDWDLWLRITKLYPIAFMNGYFSSYRIHPQSVMRKSTSLAKMYWSCCKAVLKHRNISKRYDKIIAKHLHTYVIGMYRLGVIDKILLKENIIYNKTLKAAIYFCFGILNFRLNQKFQMTRKCFIILSYILGKVNLVLHFIF